MRPAPARMSLEARIVWVVLGSTLCISLFSTWTSSRAVGRFARAYVDAALPAQLDLAERVILSWYTGRESELAAVAEAPELTRYVRAPGDGTRAAAATYLGRELERLAQASGFVGLAVVAESAEESVDGLDLSVGGWEPSHRAVDAPSISGARGHRLRTPIDPQGSVWLVGTLPLEELDTLLVGLPRWVSARVSVIDAAGVVIASAVEGKLGERRALPSSPGVHADRVGDRHVLASSRPLGRFGWTLESSVPAAEILAPARSVLQTTFVAYFAIALLCCGGAFVLARSVVRPLRALCVAARRIAEGEPPGGLDVAARDDELGLLVRTFRYMAACIERQHAELEATNASLVSRNGELERLNGQLERLSVTDGLTDLYNHRYFQEHLTREIARVDRSREPLALVLIDIDHFKQLNDRYGHAAGDAVLRRVAKVMQALTRGSDLLARYGGEEFALVPRQAGLEGAVRIAEKIRLGIAATAVELPDEGTAEGGEPLRVTVSIGIASYGGDRAELFRAADRALYQAKASGRDCVVVSE